ncbi:hypothetical protein KR018_007614, partial [Drosophila ironensis]
FAVLTLLLSICLILAVAAPWAMAFSSIPTPEPTPPTGTPTASTVSGETTSFPGPPTAAPTDSTPEVNTIYPIY